MTQPAKHIAYVIDENRAGITLADGSPEPSMTLQVEKGEIFFLRKGLTELGSNQAEAAALWPLIKAYAETGKLSLAAAPVEPAKPSFWPDVLLGVPLATPLILHGMELIPLASIEAVYTNDLADGKHLLVKHSGGKLAIQETGSRREANEFVEKLKGVILKRNG